ncbi:MAG: hypothetical protein U1E56_11855 [Bauldia sp.]
MRSLLWRAAAFVLLTAATSTVMALPYAPFETSPPPLVAALP